MKTATLAWILYFFLYWKKKPLRKLYILCWIFLKRAFFYFPLFLKALRPFLFSVNHILWLYFAICFSEASCGTAWCRQLLKILFIFPNFNEDPNSDDLSNLNCALPPNIYSMQWVKFWPYWCQLCNLTLKSKSLNPTGVGPQDCINA